LLWLLIRIMNARSRKLYQYMGSGISHDNAGRFERPDNGNNENKPRNRPGKLTDLNVNPIVARFPACNKYVIFFRNKNPTPGLKKLTNSARNPLPEHVLAVNRQFIFKVTAALPFCYKPVFAVTDKVFTETNGVFTETKEYRQALHVYLLHYKQETTDETVF